MLPLRKLWGRCVLLDLVFPLACHMNEKGVKTITWPIDVVVLIRTLELK